VNLIELGWGYPDTSTSFRGSRLLLLRCGDDEDVEEDVDEVGLLVLAGERTTELLEKNGK